MKSFWLAFLLLVITVKVYSQCTLQATIQPSNNSICSGNPVTLSAVVTGGKNYSYSWNTGETTPTISVNKAGTYAVTVADVQSGCSPVTKQIVITSSARPDAPTALGATVCYGDKPTLAATSPGGTYQWYKEPSGGNAFYTGSTYQLKDPLTVSTTFYVETTVAGCTSDRTPVTINVTPGPTVYGTTVCYGNTATITASGAESYKWYSVPTDGSVIGTESAYTTPDSVKAARSYYVEAVVNGCLSPRISVPVYVNALPPPPTAANVTICAGSTANLAATAPGGTYEWFDTAIGGAALIVSPDFTTPVLFATTTYYLQTNLNGCTSTRTPVTVTVTPVPNAPIADGLTVCAKQQFTLTARGSTGTYEWIDASGTLIPTGETLTIAGLDVSTTYYVQTTVAGCTSARTAVAVNVKPIPVNPSVSNVIICSGSNATLSIISPEGDHEWFDVPEGGTIIATGDSLVTPNLTEGKIYYVQTNINGCTSSRSAVSVTVLSEIAPPVATGISICAGNKATLSATSNVGKVEWYDAPTGGTLLITNSIFITPSISTTTTYYVQSVSGNCVSTRIPVVVTIGQFQPPPLVNDVSVCYGSDVVLTANGTGTMKWFDAATGGSLLKTGSTFELTGLKSNRTFYVESTENDCTSTRTSVSATVIPVPDRDFYYPSGTYCPLGTNAIPVINNSLGGTFTATPASGIHFVDTSTGEIDMSTSISGTYLISFTNNSPCANISSQGINITTTPNASFSYDPEYCQNGHNPRAVFLPTASAGKFTSSPVGLQFVGDSLEIDLVHSIPNTYTITNTIDINCGGD
ncbi:MAG: type sorting protein, partial [Daejeonella sp.]|nr:type sorting protein [Daejeonella sp.]